MQAQLREHRAPHRAGAWACCGLVNIQFAIKGETVYVIEANPRASRTVPFISKATGVPLAKCAARIMAGDSIAEPGPAERRASARLVLHEGSRHALGPFPGRRRYPGSRDEVDGRGHGYRQELSRGIRQDAAGDRLQAARPERGKVFISVCDRDKRHILSVARILRYLGFDICSTEGTARVLRGGNVTCEVVEKISGPHDGERPNIGDLIADGKIAVIINTPYGPGSRGDGYLLRTEAVRRGVTCVTAMSAANTYVSAIEAVREDQQGHGSANDMGMDVIALQDLPQYTV